ncbi:MAG: transcription antitermination factor NusB [Desulfocucumaceae bacterium]
MGRRQAREAVLRTLYQVDVTGIDCEMAIKNTAEISESLEEEVEKLGNLGADDLSYARDIVFGSIKHEKEIDEMIAALSKDWNIERLAMVDHNIMRIAVFEIMYREDIPLSVSVNEAVELAKLYGSDDSGKFINGILGKLIRDKLAGMETVNAIE